MAPAVAMEAGDFQYGDDGAQGHRFRKLLADALWSRRRLFAARLIDSPHCIRCGEAEEHTLHFLWSCPANHCRRVTLNVQWGGPATPFDYEAMPLCLAQCGLALVLPM